MPRNPQTGQFQKAQPSENSATSTIGVYDISLPDTQDAKDRFPGVTFLGAVVADDAEMAVESAKLQWPGWDIEFVATPFNPAL